MIKFNIHWTVRYAKGLFQNIHATAELIIILFVSRLLNVRQFVAIVYQINSDLRVRRLVEMRSVLS